MTEETTSTIDFSIWESRWESLNSSIESYKAQLESHSLNIEGSSICALVSMLKNLQTFANAQLNFFFDGFGGQNEYKLDESAESPPSYVLGVTLKQIAYDLEIIQRAAEQRIWASESTDKKISHTLNRADHIAKEAIEAVYGTNSIEGDPPTMITYFEKSHSVRFYPHSPIALLSIPFTCIVDPSTDNIHNQHTTPDYVTLLHELGHYIFWHGKVNGEHIHKTLNTSLLTWKKNEDSWCYKWVEEIFADFIGCWLGGHVIALSAQELALVATNEEFIEDDEQHPVPAIRPQVYIETLQKIQNTSEMCNDELARQWQEHKIKRVPEKTSFTVFKQSETAAGSAHSVSTVSFDYAVSKMKDVIHEICTLLEIQSRLEWSGNISNLGVTRETLKDELYERFQEYIDSKSITALNQPPLALLQQADWKNWVTENGFLGENPFTHTDQPIRPGEGEDETQGWLNVLYAGGWATKGPTTNPCVK